MTVVKERFDRSKPHCNVGTIGHVDHGKTTLTAAITRVLSKRGTTIFKAYNQIDKHAEEQRRGITINVAHVEYETIKRHYTHMDCPGHQHYIKNMITGAAQMEGAILVVSVNDGPQEQTREHVILAKEIGIQYLVVFVNKMDILLETDLQVVVELETRELLNNYGFGENVPMVFGSARLALEEEVESDLGAFSILKLTDCLDNYVQDLVRHGDANFLMPVEEIISVQGRGTVVTGKVESGVVKLGDELELVGPRIYKTICNGLEMFNKVLDYAQAGENVGILVKGIKRTDIKRGFVAAKVGTLNASNSFMAKAYILTKEEGGRVTPFSSHYRPQFFFRTTNVTGSIILKGSYAEGNVSSKGEELIAMPGDNIVFQVLLIEVVGLNIGLRFAIREGQKTVGAGFVTEILDVVE